MFTYFAYEVCTTDRAEIQVDTDPAKLWGRLAHDLISAHLDGGLESITTGKVVATDPEEAVRKVRERAWQREGYCHRTGAPTGN